MMIGLATELIARARKALVEPVDRDNYTARALGFVNAEHEALAFFASEWYFHLTDLILSQCYTIPNQWGPIEIAQEILDQRYEGHVMMNTLEQIKEAPPFGKINGGTYKGEQYDSIVMPHKDQDVLTILKAYQEVIRWGEMDYTVVDLDVIANELKGHFRGDKAAEYRGYCDECYARVSQRDEECPNCGTPVVWFNSPTWQSLYGYPKTRIRELTCVKPEDAAGVLVCKRSGIQGFANVTEAKRWNRCVKNIGVQEMIDIVEKCAESTTGRGILSYAMNWADKLIREEESKEDAPRVIDISL